MDNFRLFGAPAARPTQTARAALASSNFETSAA
jgi:hypothetical protein